MGAGASRVLPRDSKPTSNPRLTLPDIKFLNQMDLRKMLYMGAISGSPLMVLHAIEMGEDPNRADAHTRMTPLHFAARYGNDHCIDLLVKNGAKINVPQTHGWRPIHEAAMNGHAECIEVLLDFGSHVNARTGSTIREMTPLHYAARHGHMNCVKVLVENGAEVNRYNENYETPLHVAAMRQQVEIMDYLLDHGANIKARTINNTDAAYISTQIGCTLALRRLIMRGGINLEAAYHEGLKLLHVAIINARVQTMESLLEAGADTESRTYVRKLTPIHMAAKHGQTECLKMLLEHGADALAVCARQCTALHHAAKRKQKETAEILLDAGVDINAVTAESMETALHISMALKDTDLIKFLVEKGADINIPDFRNKTALQLAWDEEIKNILTGQNKTKKKKKK